MPSAFALAALLLHASAPAPAAHAPSQRELGGLLLGQYEKGVRASLGEPKETEKAGENARTLLYSLAGDLDTYFVVTVDGEEDGTVTAIQMSGKPKAGLPKFDGVSLGDSRATVERTFGAPDKVKPIGDIPGDLASYDDRDYSFEYSPDGKLISIKIFGEEGFAANEKTTRPDLAGFAKAIQERDRSAIFEYLAPDVEVYTKDDETVSFNGPARADLEDEKSLVARYLFGGAGSLRDILTPSLLKGVEVKDRAHTDDDERVFPTAEFPKSSGLQEIVWRYSYGKWRVWEIDLNPDDEELRGRRL